MERLQAAIEKARRQREAAGAAQPPAPSANPSAAAEAAAPERTGHPATQDAAAQPPADIAALWQALPLIELPAPRRLGKNRVIAPGSGVDSAPFDLLRTRMLQQAKKNGWRRIAVVSPHGGCGKSTTVANLAFSLARQSDMRTLAFDFDLRRRGLTRLLEQSPANNLWQVLEGKVDFAENGQRFGTNVAFGLNAAPATQASEILQSGQTARVLDAIDARYAPDIVLFDLPPLMASDDNFGFLSRVDAALLMIAAEKTTMSQIDVAERQVADLTNVMGLVLNQCRFTSGAYGHDYGEY